MALTRALLKGMNLTDEQVNSIIEAHTETVDGLKAERDKYRTDAEKLPDVQKQLDALKNGEDWKAKFDTEHAAFEKYKADVASKETLTNTKSAYRKLLDALKIDKDDADLIMAATDFSSMKLEKDGSLEKADDLTNNIKERYARYIPTIDTKGAQVANPPKPDNSGANSRAAELAKMYHERRYGTAPTGGK